MGCILITRPRSDALALAFSLRQKGFNCVIEPMLEIVVRPDPLVLPASLQALALTSANGARALAVKIPPSYQSLPVMAVGQKTAETVRSLGFSRVERAWGNIGGLADLIRARLDPCEGPILHVAGSVIAGDLGASLAPAGFTVLREKVYDSVAAQELSPQTLCLWYERQIDAVVFFSARSARTFCGLVHRYVIADFCRRAVACCLSPQVAGGLAGLSFREVRVARRPCEDDVLTLLTTE